MKNFVLIGAAGYIAPRHMKAVKETGHNLVAAMDPNDSVGIIDSYFPNAHFFTEMERFDRYLEKIKSEGTVIDYFIVCSPNYLHDAHVRFGLKHGGHVICEKPLVLNPWNLDSLLSLEQKSQRSVYNILQLRLHHEIIQLKERIAKSQSKRHQIELNYIAPRGLWYHHSWKGDVEKSGGITTNIGIHFFDMLLWIFGKAVSFKVDYLHDDSAKGTLNLENADVNWYLSTKFNDLKGPEKASMRELKINDEVLDFSKGFENLHTQCYKDIINGKGFLIEDCRPSIELVSEIRQNISKD